MTTTLASLGIDPSNSPYRSADLLLASKLTALYEYAKILEERVKELDSPESQCSTCRGSGALVDPSGSISPCWDCNMRIPWNPILAAVDDILPLCDSRPSYFGSNEEWRDWAKRNPFPRGLFNVPADQLAQLYIESGKTDMFPKGKMTMALFQLATSVGDLFDGAGWNKWRKDYLEAFEKDESVLTETA